MTLDEDRRKVLLLFAFAEAVATYAPSLLALPLLWLCHCRCSCCLESPISYQVFEMSCVTIEDREVTEDGIDKLMRSSFRACNPMDIASPALRAKGPTNLMRLLFHHFCC
jgi:hypothetical protein